MEKGNIKLGVKMFGNLAIVTILCLFVAMSFLVLSSSFFTEEIGYTATVFDADNKQIEQYEYRYADGDDIVGNTYIAKGYNVNKQTVRSPISKTGNVVFALVINLANGLASAPYAFFPANSASNSTVPVPQNGSRTSPPLGQK